MFDWLNPSKIQIGLDLATSVALIFSAVGVAWRLGSLSRKLQQKQIESENEHTKLSLLNSRERARVEFLLSINDELSEQLRSFVSALRAASEKSDKVEPETIDSELKKAIQDCWNWMQKLEPRLVAIGTREQVADLKRTQRHFLQSVGEFDGEKTLFNPKQMLDSLKKLQKEILVDTRSYLFNEERDDAERLVEESI